MTTRALVQHLLSIGAYSVDENGIVWRNKVRRGNKYSGFKWYDVKPVQKGRPTPQGYLAFSVHHHGKVYTIPCHTFVAVAYLGARESKYQVNHINGVKTDNRPANLEYTTASGNALHACRVLGHRQGEAHGRAKLTNEQARDIRYEYANSDVTQQALADMYGVCKSAVCHIVKRNRYARV